MYDEKIKAARSMFLFFCSLCFGAYVTFQLGNSEASPKKPPAKSIESAIYSDNIKPLDEYLKGQPNIVHYEKIEPAIVFNQVSSVKKGEIANAKQ